jgi:CubicO group peptidase (beta-lactamase class C family)
MKNLFIFKVLIISLALANSSRAEYCQADYDLNFHVDGLDLAVFVRQFNQSTCTVPPCRNDVRLFASFFGRDDCLGCPDGFILDMTNPGDDPFVETNPHIETIPKIPNSDFTCRQEESCKDKKCSDAGTCMVVDGNAVCVCRPGWSGEDCSDCAVGFEKDARGNCVLGNTCREEYCYGKGDCAVDTSSGDLVCECDEGFSGPDCGGPDIVISGPETSIYQGESIKLTATGSRDGTFIWRIKSGPGNLDGDGTPTRSTLYTADFSSKTVEYAIVQATDPFTGQHHDFPLAVGPPNTLPITGTPVSGLSSFDDAMLEFMRGRGIRAGVLAVAKDGLLVLSRGYGYMDEGSDDDPFIHEGPGESGPIVPPDALMRLASVTKPITAAAVRDALADMQLDPEDEYAMPWVDASLSTGVGGQASFPYTDDGRPLHVENPVYNTGGYQCPAWPNSMPDSRWDLITIQHLLEHRAGFNRGSHPSDRWKFTTEESGGFEPPGHGADTSMGASWADPNFKPVMAIHDLEAGTPGSLTLEGPLYARDLIQYFAGVCLNYTPGSGDWISASDRYSNFGYTLLGRVLEGLHSRKWSPGSGGNRPVGWGPYSDIIEEFLAQKGISDILPGKSGSARFCSDGLTAGNPREPYYRYLNNDGVDFGLETSGVSYFNVADPFDYDEDFDQMRFGGACLVFLPAAYGGFSMATMEAHGGLIASAPAMIKFMRWYRLAPSGNYGGIGEPRTSTSQGDASHSGLLPGTRALAWQMPSGSISYNVPLPIGAWDQTTDPSAQFQILSPGSCSLDSGIDVVVLFNQSRDPKNEDGRKYTKINDFITRAACEVTSWPVVPPPALQIKP